MPPSLLQDAVLLQIELQAEFCAIFPTNYLTLSMVTRVFNYDNCPSGVEKSQH